MGTPTDLREQRRERVRADILAAAWRLAERDGIAGLALRDLAAEVGMRAPSLYTYFDGKDAIYDAMFAQGYEQLQAHAGGVLAEVEGREALPALTVAAERWLEFCQASIPRYQLMFTRALPGWEPSAEAYAVSREAYARMADALAAVGVTGRASLDLFTAVTSGLAAQQLANDPGGDRWVRLAPDAMRMFLSHLDRDDPDRDHPDRDPDQGRQHRSRPDETEPS